MLRKSCVAEKRDTEKATGGRKLPTPQTMTGQPKKLEETNKCLGTSKGMTRSVANKARLWEEDDSDSKYEPALLPCGVKAWANAKKRGPRI